MIDIEINKLDSDGLCNQKLTKPLVDLKNIQIITDLKKNFVKNYPKNYQIAVFHKGKKMKLVKKITSGANGEVLIYKKDEYSVVVKKSIEDPYEEPLIISKFLEKSGYCDHYIIPFRLIFDQNNNPFVIMQEANGSLDSLKLTDDIKKAVIVVMAEFLQCFIERGLIYSDFKLENMLYKCEGKKLCIFLGDIGSFEQVGKLNITVTHPPPESLEKRVSNSKEMAYYVFGATVAQLYDLDYDLYWENPESKEKKTYREMKNYYYPLFVKGVIKSKIDKEIKKLILDFTEFNPVKREKNNFYSVIKDFKKYLE
jgi:serine/threonine protein kinase